MKTLWYDSACMILRDEHIKNPNLSGYLHSELRIARRLANKIHSDFLTTGRLREYWLSIMGHGIDLNYCALMAVAEYHHASRA